MRSQKKRSKKLKLGKVFSPLLKSRKVLSAINVALLLGLANGANAAPADTSRPFNDYTWLTTHNSFSNPEDNPDLLFDYIVGSVENQNTSVRQQLQDGVRGLMLDTRWMFNEDIYLCHGDCIAHIDENTGLGVYDKKFSAYLEEIKDFLDANPSEVITIMLEDYIRNVEIKKRFEQAGLQDFIFSPASYGVSNTKPWPSLARMIATNERLVVFINNNGAKDESFGIARDWTWTIQNRYGNDSLVWDKRYEHCTDDGGSDVLNTVNKYKLFTMNHFPDTHVQIVNVWFPNRIHSNVYDQLSAFTHARANYADRFPNYIAVDYYEQDDAIDFVQDLETMKRFGIGFVMTHDGHTETPNGYYRNPISMNHSVWGATDIFLVTKGTAAEAPLTVITGGNANISCPSTHPHKLDGDLNKGARNDFIYFCAKDREKYKVVFDNNACGNNWTKINAELNLNTLVHEHSVYLCVNENPDYYLRLKNRWKSSFAINVETGSVLASAVDSGATSSWWGPVPVSVSGDFRLRNEWKGCYLEVESNGDVTCGPFKAGSSWKFEAAPEGHKYLKHNSGCFVNIESGPVKCNTIAGGAHSSQWHFEGVSGSSCTAYTDGNFKGAVYRMNKGDNVANLGNDFNDKISSIRLAPTKCTFTGWEHANYTGNQYQFTADYGYTGDSGTMLNWNDQISSMKCSCQD